MECLLTEIGRHAPASLNEQFDELCEKRERLLAHSIYDAISTESRLRLFMERHVFAVWDFMSLLKKMQRRYTCCEIPWQTPSNPLAARLINQIVLDEESDLDKDGNPCSHLDLYLLAMNELGCNTMPFVEFIWALRNRELLSDGLERANAPSYVMSFVKHTIAVASTHPDASLIATFLFGREEPIPMMFQRIYEAELAKSIYCENFKHYLNRHIHADSTEHGPAAVKLLLGTLGGSTSSWEVALQAGIRSIGARIALWDGIYGEILERENLETPDILIS